MSSSHGCIFRSETYAPVPRPLSPRDMWLVQDYQPITEGEASGGFFTYNHSLEHPEYFAAREGFVRATVKYQGKFPWMSATVHKNVPLEGRKEKRQLTAPSAVKIDCSGMVGKPTSTSSCRLTWLVNVKIGGLIPPAFLTMARLNLMVYPLTIVKDAQRWAAMSKSMKTTNSDLVGRRAEFQGGAEVELGIEDCIIDSGRFPNIEGQRFYFQAEMSHMARGGHDEDDGWLVYGKTQTKDISPEQQLQVHARIVEWSPAKQLRSVLETNLSTDEVFELLCTASISKTEFAVATEFQERALNVEPRVLFTHEQDDCVTVLLYREVPFQCKMIEWGRLRSERI